MTYHSDPVPFWCPLDPAVWNHYRHRESGMRADRIMGVLSTLAADGEDEPNTVDRARPVPLKLLRHRCLWIDSGVGAWRTFLVEENERWRWNVGEEETDLLGRADCRPETVPDRFAVSPGG